MRGFDLILANGDKITCNPNENANIYVAGRVNVGTYGVFSKAALYTAPVSSHTAVQIPWCPFRKIDHLLNTPGIMNTI